MLNNQPQIATIILRKIVPADALVITTLRNTPQVLKYLDATVITNAKQANTYIAQLRNEKTNYARVIVYNGILVGICYLKDFNTTHRFAFITFYLNNNYWGKGIMQHALTHFISTAFVDIPALHRIEAQVHEHNEGSCALLARIGFTKEGEARNNFFVNEQPFNSQVYSLLRTDVVNAAIK